MDNHDGEVKIEQKGRQAALLMKRILIHFRAQMDERLRPKGVTTAQLQVIKIIRQEPGVSGADLARACYITPQSAQALVKQIEDAGWIRRERVRPSDRALNAYLTSAGEALFEEVEKAWQGIEARLWQGMDEHTIDTLNTLLEQCLANLESNS